MRNVEGSILEDINLSNPQNKSDVSYVDIDDLLLKKGPWKDEATGWKVQLLQDWLL